MSLLMWFEWKQFWGSGLRFLLRSFYQQNEKVKYKWEIVNNNNVAKLEHSKIPNAIDALDFNTIYTCIDKSKIIQKAIKPFWCLIKIHDNTFGFSFLFFSNRRCSLLIQWFNSWSDPWAMSRPNMCVVCNVQLIDSCINKIFMSSQFI